MKCPVCENEVVDRYRSRVRRPASDIYISSGNHKKLVLARNLITEAKTLEEGAREEQSEARKQLVPEYSYKVTVGIQRPDRFSKCPEGAEYVVITATLTNEDIFKEHMRFYGSISSPPESGRSSVRYYRKHGILFHDSGGWLILEDEVPFSDEDWNALKAGKVEGFIK